MEKCPRVCHVAYSLICHNPCDVLSSVWHRGSNLSLGLDTPLELLTGTLEAPGIVCKTVSVQFEFVSVCEHMHIFLHRDLALHGRSTAET